MGSFRGLQIRSNCNYNNFLNNHEKKQYDLLFIPGGLGTIRECNNNNIIQYIQKISPYCNKIMTVCSGSAIIAKSGILNGCKATTNKISFTILQGYGPKVNWIQNARWVESNKFYTSSGVSAGTDLAIRMVEIFTKEGMKNDNNKLSISKIITNKMKYKYNHDCNNDPFARKNIGYIEIILSNLIRNIVNIFYNIGFALSLPMKQKLDI